MGRATKASNRANLQSKRVTSAVLIAAGAFLGTSLGVCASAPEEPTGARNTSNAAQRKPFDQTILADKVSIKTPSVHVTPTHTTGKTNTTQSNQSKMKSNQIKEIENPGH